MRCVEAHGIRYAVRHDAGGGGISGINATVPLLLVLQYTRQPSPVGGSSRSMTVELGIDLTSRLTCRQDNM